MLNVAKKPEPAASPKKDVQIGVRIPASLKRRLQKIAAAEHRRYTDVARLLMERGLAGYERDEKLILPLGHQQSAKGDDDA